VPLGSIWLALVAYALLAFPSGRLHSTADWVVVACLAVAFVFVWIPVLLLTPDIGRLFDCDTCPSNPLAVADVQAAGDALIWVRVVLLVAAFALMCFLLGLRWRRATPTQRRSLTPILFTGLLLAAVFVLSGALYLAPGLDALADGMEWAIYPVVVAVPFAFLFGLARSHLFRTGAVASLVQRLGGRLDAGELRDALADALGDPSLAIAFWLFESRRYVDAGGRPAELPAEDSSRATTPIEHDGRPVAALIHDAALREEPELVRGLGTAASLALENERLEAELRAKVEEVRQSRARLVTRATPSAAGSSVTSTTARSSASSPLRCSCDAHGRSSPTTRSPPRCSTAPLTSCQSASRSFASSPAASTRPSSVTKGWPAPCGA
jgi:hypothetical protein